MVAEEADGSLRQIFSRSSRNGGRRSIISRTEVLVQDESVAEEVVEEDRTS